MSESRRTPLAEVSAVAIVSIQKQRDRLKAQMELKDRQIEAAWDCLVSIVAACVAGKTAAELADIAAGFIAPSAPITEEDMEWARAQIRQLQKGDSDE